MLEVLAWINSHGAVITTIVLAVEMLIGVSPLKSNSTISLILNGVKKLYEMITKKKIEA